MKVTYNNKEYECSVAYRRGGYAKLLDDLGYTIAAFEGVKDYSLFTLSGGTWSDCPNTEDLPLAILRPDGTIASSGKKCNEVGGGGKSIVVAVSNNLWEHREFTIGAYNTHVYASLCLAMSSDTVPPKYAAIEMPMFNMASQGNANVTHKGNGESGLNSIGFPPTVNYEFLSRNSHRIAASVYTLKVTSSDTTRYDTYIERYEVDRDSLTSERTMLYYLLVPVEEVIDV